MTDDRRLVDEYLDPWLEGYLAEAVEREAAEAGDGQEVDLTSRLGRVVECAELVEKVWGGALAPSRTTAHGIQGVAAWSGAMPERLGRFLIRRELGHGGGGVVFLAFDPALQREVALKIPQPYLLSGTTVRERFLREARAAASLDHANIISVYETGLIGPVHYIASAYCPGPTLHRWMVERSEPVPVSWAVRTLVALADGVQHAHSRGVWHRDLKPGNVLLEPCRNGSGCASCRGRACEFTPKISDFGLALLVESELEQPAPTEGADESGRDLDSFGNDLTRTGAILGTAAYMSPEQASAHNDQIGPHTDVHALGIILYELLTRKRPFEKASHLETLTAVQREDAAPILRYRPDVPRDLEAICLKCLEKEPTRRYHTAAQLAEDLRRFARGELVQARSIGRLERWARCLRRHPTQAALLAACATTFTVLVIGLAIHNAQLKRLTGRLQAALDNSEHANHLVRQRENEVRELWYSADLQLAHRAWLEGDSRHYRMLLERHRLAGTGRARQGWEWQVLWQLGNVQQTELFRSEKALYTVRFSPDGRRMATAGGAAEVVVLDSRSGAVRQKLSTEQKEVNSVAFSPDGRHLATAGDDGSLHIYDLESGQLQHGIQVSQDLLLGVVYTPDGKLLATGGVEPVVRLWNPASGESVGELVGHERSVECLVFGPDGRRLATASSDGTAMIWDVATGKRLATLRGHEGRLVSVAFAPSGRLLATCGLDRRVLVWDVPSGKRRYSAMHLDGVQSLAFSPDGGQLAAGDKSGGIRIWNLPKQRTQSELMLSTMWQAHESRVYSLAYGLEDEQLFSTGSDGRLVRWRQRSGPEQMAIASQLAGVEADVECVAVIQDGQFVVTSHSDGVRVWQVADGQLVHTLTCEPNEWTEVCVSRDGNWVAACGRTGWVAVWTWPAGRLAARWQLRDYCDATYRLAMSRDNQVLAVAQRFTDSDQLRLFATFTGQLLPGPPPGPCDAAAFSPQADLLAVDRNHDLVLWNLAEQRVEWIQPQVHESTISDIRFSGDGTRIATASHDRQIKLWSSASGQLLSQITGNRAAVRAIVFAPDDRSLVSGDEDGTLTLWYLATGQSLLELVGQPAPIRDLELLSDQNRLVYRTSKWRAAVLSFDHR